MRHKIIEAAKRRFFRYGLRKVTMDEIASDLAVSKKTLYRHFDGKEALAEAVIRVFQSEMTELVERAKRDTPDPVERFERCVVEASRKRSEINNIFLTDIKRDIPELWREIEAFREDCIVRHLGDILQEGMKKGKIRSDIDAQLATNIYLGAMQTVMQPDALDRQQCSFETAFNNLSRIFLEGVKAK